MNLEKSFDPRKTQKARKFSKIYLNLDRHPKGIGIYNGKFWRIANIGKLELYWVPIS